MFKIFFDIICTNLGQNDKTPQSKAKKKKMTDEEILARLSNYIYAYS